jgi:hypothetical protein
VLPDLQGGVIALIEAEFAMMPAFGHCGSQVFCRWAWRAA